MIKLEDYISERQNAWKDTWELDCEYKDELTGEIVGVGKENSDRLKFIISGLDEKYKEQFNGQYILHRRHELDKWRVYILAKIKIQDEHQLIFTIQKIGKNFTKYNHKEISFRKGVFRSTTEEEIKELFGWHNKKTKTYKEKYLYIFKNELNRIKIGQATNPEQRLINIKSQAGLEIEMLNKVECAAKYEKELHGLFKSFRYKYEWFTLNKEQEEWLTGLNKVNIDIEIEYMKKFLKSIKNN